MILGKPVYVILFSLGLIFVSTSWFLANSAHPNSTPKHVPTAYFQQKAAEHFFLESYDFLGTEQILDIGSGDGRLTAKIATKVPDGKVIGIDHAEPMVHYASQNYIRPNVQFILKDAKDLSFYDQHKAQFDIVVSFEAMHWIAEQLQVIRGAHTVLKPNGKLFLRFFSEKKAPIEKMADELIASEKWRVNFNNYIDPIHRFKVKQYKNFLKKAGFKIRRLELIRTENKLSSKRALTRYLQSWLPHVNHLSPKYKEEFMQELLDKFLEYSPADKEGLFHLYGDYLEVEAVKAS